MDIDLTDFSQTLAIGAFTIAGIWGLIALTLGSFQPSRAAKLLPSSVETVVFADNWFTRIFAVVFVSAVGLLAEDISNKYVDTDDLIEWIDKTLGSTAGAPDDRCNQNSRPRYMPAALFPRTEASTRREALFGDRIGEGKIGELAMTVAHVGAFRNHGAIFGLSVERELLLIDASRVADALGPLPNGIVQPAIAPSLACEANLEWLATRVYYPAKNRVYQEGNYYEELAAIQKRIDFARSITLIAATLFIAMFAIAAVKLLAWLVFSTHRVLKDEVWSLPPLNLSSKRRWAAIAVNLSMSWTLRVLLGGGVLAGTLYACSLFSYHAEEMEFNRRTFGYYANLIADPQSQVNIVASGMGGVSAALQLPRNEGYIAIADAKENLGNHIDISRIAHLKLTEQGMSRFVPIPTIWKKEHPTPSDLEAACWVQPGETLLVIEGSYRPQANKSESVEPRRILLLRIVRQDLGLTAEEQGSWTITGNDPLGEVEGIVCLGSDPGSVTILAAERERPGAPAKENMIKIVPIHLRGDGTAHAGEAEKLALGNELNSFGRVVSELLLTPSNELLAVATEDPSDIGPFKSAIYKLGTVGPEGKIAMDIEIRARLDGFKVEALAPIDADHDAIREILIGTDDESFGSQWRRVRLTGADATNAE
jgi:hypothetical protein